jgi:oxygen-independent coproporphyrinogen-3 oxidase
MSSAAYVHLPFCAVHCAYCPFAISTDVALQDEYAEAVVREIASRAREGVACGAPSPGLDSIYFGGGTPSRTSLPNLRRIVDALHSHFTIADDAEFSLEANPEDVNEESLDGWRALGVNRLSIGVQSFDDDELRAIGRIHDAATARHAVSLAVRSGIRTSLDLIAGLPGARTNSFAATLNGALALGAGHLSLYMLDLDETTPLQVQVARGRTTVPDDEIVAAQYRDAIERIARAGLEQYEISNFARPGEECRHNLRYWTRGEYHGFGMAAHSFAGERRFANTRNIRKYVADPEHACDFEEVLGDGERRRELIFLRLRQTSGIDYDLLVETCGQEGIAWVSRGIEDGWLRRHGSQVAFTPAGFLLSNDYISRLF